MQIDGKVLREVEAGLVRAHENTQALSDDTWRFHVGLAARGITVALATLRKEMEGRSLLSERLEVEARWPDLPDKWKFWASHDPENIERAKTHAIECGALEVRVVRVSREVMEIVEDNTND